MSSLPLPSTLNLLNADNELLSRRFTTSDPEGEPLILDHIPEGATGLYIDLAYHLSEKAVLVRCRHCRPKSNVGNHRIGYVVRTSTGEGFLVGHRCGALHYPDRWGIISGRYDRDKDRRDTLLRVGELLSAWPVLKAEVQAAIRSPIWGVHDVARDGLRQQLPDLDAFLLMRLERFGGDLSIVERLRDLAAEAKRPDGAKGGAIYVERVRQMGSIGGREFLTGTGALKNSVEQEGAALACLVADLNQNHGTMLTEGLKSLLRKITSTCSRLKVALDRVRSLRSFFEKAHLERLCICATNWSATRRRVDRYVFHDGGIAWMADGVIKGRWSAQLCDIPAAPRLEAVAGQSVRLRRA